MKILITGANGFIGKNLVATLKGTDNELILIDRNNSKQRLPPILPVSTA